MHRQVMLPPATAAAAPAAAADGAKVMNGLHEGVGRGGQQHHVSPPTAPIRPRVVRRQERRLRCRHRRRVPPPLDTPLAQLLLPSQLPPQGLVGVVLRVVKERLLLDHRPAPGQQQPPRRRPRARMRVGGRVGAVRP